MPPKPPEPIDKWIRLSDGTTYLISESDLRKVQNAITGIAKYKKYACIVTLKERGTSGKETRQQLHIVAVAAWEPIRGRDGTDIE